MNKSSRNLGAVLAVLVLLLLIAGLVFVVVTVYKDPLQAEIASQESSAMESTTQTSETEPVYVAPKRIALFETADINGYLMNTTSGDPETFEYRLAYVAKVVENARESEDFDDVILIDGGPQQVRFAMDALRALGAEVPVAAVALGARVIEKHLTLDRPPGDAESKFALLPEEFADRVVRDLRPRGRRRRPPLSHLRRGRYVLCCRLQRRRLNGFGHCLGCQRLRQPDCRHCRHTCR